MPPDTRPTPPLLVGVPQRASDSLPISASATLDSILSDAEERGVSDVHLNPERDGIRVRMRIDGLLHATQSLDLSMHAALIARIKILSGLRTDEHYSAQDGRFPFRTRNGTECDIRVSVAPTYYGENAVLRLLSTSKETQTLRGLGFRNSHRLMLERGLERPHGMILATGPTGSGKTTLLYALTRMLDSDTRSIVTLEDPIEYSLPGINQIPVNAERGLSFATGLRSVLRQDPDVIMVGEIRDEETARLAVNASLTGHLVLSTLHTNDAVSAVLRLTDIGIERYLTATTVSLVVAQRLVRRICIHCCEAHQPAERFREHVRKILPKELQPQEQFFMGSGCITCGGSGYHGRIGVFEILMVDEFMRGAISDGADSDALRKLAVDQGMLFMAGDGVRKARKALTTLEEISRISHG